MAAHPRILAFALLLFYVPLGLAGLFGCIPYMYPSLEATRPINLAQVADEVHVFRVNLTSASGGCCCSSGHDEYSLEEIPLIAGNVPPQVRASVDRGLIIIGVALNHHFHYHDGVHVRLYRPQYELCQFKSWEIGKKVEWIPVRDVTGREKAIDDLLAPPATANCGRHVFTRDETAKASWTIPPGLRTGAKNEKCRHVLRFAMLEYEILLASRNPECADDMKMRLRDKIRQLQPAP